MPLRADSFAIVGGTSDGLLITLIAWQPLNAYSPMVSNDFGKLSDFSDVQPLNARLPIVVRFSHLNKSSDFSDRQPRNANSPILVISSHSKKLSDFNDLHPLNA